MNYASFQNYVMIHSPLVCHTHYDYVNRVGKELRLKNAGISALLAGGIIQRKCTMKLLGGLDASVI